MHDVDWIQNEPLEKVVKWVHAKVDNDASWLDGAIMATLAKRLITTEAAPGGPYKNDDGEIDESLNRNIDDLFCCVGVSLPGLEKYLNTKSGYVRGVHRKKEAHQPRSVTSNLARQRAMAIIESFGGELRGQARRNFASILKVDAKGEISRLAELFGESLAVSAPCNYETLGAANLLTWIAYSVYDDFLDGEGVPQTLPVANAAHREAYALYLRHTPHDYQSLCADIFRGMDEANAWELAQCRFATHDGAITIDMLPDYKDQSVLARRAGAHVLGPLITLRVSGVSDDQFEQAQTALYDYLIARQYNDDLHDWVEDFSNGHISPVVAHLIRKAKISPGKQSIEDSLKRMQHEFWNGGLVELSETALSAIARAEKNLVGSDLMKTGALFIKDVLLPIRRSLERGLDHHAKDKEFAAAYRSR